MEIFGAITTVFEVVGPTVRRQCGYIVSCNSHVSDLKREIKNLRDASTRLRHEVDHADGVGDIIEDYVWSWLNEAEELIKSKNLILEKNVSLPDIRALVERGKFDGVSYRPTEELDTEVKVRSATSSSSTVRYVELKSRALVLKRIMADLNDHNKVGVYGMGGVGKTTLLRDVEKLARESGKFDDVINVFVSQAPNIEDIKSKIRNKLGSLGSNEDQGSKKTLLILLDDLWSKLNGVEVLENGFKVKIKWVMTSRKQELLANDMECYPTISLGELEEQEVWGFFGELVNNKKVEDMKNNPAVATLLKKCAGLPVSIEALATVLEKKGLSSCDLVIEDVLKLGKESISGSASLELSYNYLGDTEVANLAKSLFRIIGLLGTPTVPILTLLKYTIGLGLLGSSSSDNNIMERARRQVSISLRMLQDASLLLESDDSDYVKIHDVVRDVAASITSRDDRALIFDRDGLKGWSLEKLKKSTSLYLPYSAIPKLKEGWECPQLSIFIMEAAPAQGGDHVLSRRKKRRGHQVELPSSFYKGMVKLKVVDLRYARLTWLPSSIQSDLCKLTTLFLHFCCIENVSVIGKLKSLQILSFVGSDLACLPKEIGGLTKLRMLDLSKCSELKMIEPDTLKRLTRLEELYIKESFDGWEVEGAEQPINSSLAELNCLPRLKTLEVYIPDTDSLPISLPLSNLVRYKVLIGDSWDWSAGEYRESRTLKFKENSKNILNEDWIQSCLQTTQDLYLDGLSGVGGSFHEQCRERFEELKHLHLQNCSLIECIIWSMEWLECSAFTTLESMVLEKMESLEVICNGRISSSSFSKLKVVRVQECHKLTSLFNLPLLKNLTELEEIEICNCENVGQIVIAEQIDHHNNDGAAGEEQIVATSGCSNIFFRRSRKRLKKEAEEGTVVADDEIKLLGNLRYLKLRKLPKITSFFNPSESMETTLATVFFNDQKVSQPPKYKEIQSTTCLGLEKLQRIELTDCKNVVHFTNSHVLLKLVNLESLTISGCESLQYIFDLEGIEPGHGNFEILPKLYELKLRELPKLDNIWKNSKQIKGCGVLRTVDIYKCNNLLYLSSSFMCEGMESLTEINVGYCEKMEALFLEEEGSGSNASSIKAPLTSLKILVISNCSNLKAFLSANNCPTISTGTPSGLSDDSSAEFKCNNKGVAYLCYGKKVVDTSNLQVDTSNSFFNQKVFLPSLESLILSSVGEFEKLWCGEIPSDQSYCNLQYLHVQDCPNLQTVIPASMIERLHFLKQLWVKRCNKLKMVFDFDAGWKTENMSKALMLPQLQDMKLESLLNLTHVMKGGGSSDEIVVGFPSLRQLHVKLCRNLINLVPTITATTLLELKSLDVYWCPEMQEVICGELSGRYKRNAIIFPHLTSLSLSALYRLTCFSSESYRFDFPCLKTLEICMCTRLKTLIKPRSNSLIESESEDQGMNAATQVLFNHKVQLPNLEGLSISNFEVQELWCNEPHTAASFCKLKFLKIKKCSTLQNIIPSFMLKRLQKLESLRISGCESLQDIFNITSTQVTQSAHEESIVENGHAPERIIHFAKLTSLKLGDNIKLNNLWSGSYTLELPSLKQLIFKGTDDAAVEAIMKMVYLPNLEELKVSSKEITQIWHSEPRVGSFTKLKRLEVQKCEGLEKITPLFMSKRLQNLEIIEVKSCNNLEIVCELEWLIDARDSESSKLLLPCFPFQNLASIHVEKCERLMSVFSIISSEQHLDQYGGETTDDSDKLVLQLPKLTDLRLTDLSNFSHLFLQAGQCVLELPSLKDFSLIEAGDKEAVTHKVVFPKDVEIQVRDMSNLFGTITSVLTGIVKDIQKTNELIIGLLGYMNNDVVLELQQQLEGEEANLFHQVVTCSGGETDIQEALEEKWGIVNGRAEIEGRAERARKNLLSYIRNKRLLLIVTDIDEEDMVNLEAVGIPLDGFNRKHFKIVLISKEKEILFQMGAKLTIPIGSVGGRWTIFVQELHYLTEGSPTFLQQQQQEEEELPTFDTNKDPDICSFLGRPSTVLLNNIMKVLGSNRNNDQIIGMLGSASDNENLFKEVSRLHNGGRFFDYSVALTTNDNEVDAIQEQLKRQLGITTSNSEIAGQRIHQILLYNQQKRVLFEFHNLDRELDIEAVGIPLGPKSFKIMLFSNKTDVLQKMGTQQVFEIIASTEKYWFYRMLDGYVDESVYQKLADECGSDDLAKLLAKKLKTRGLRAWVNALRRLKESPYEYEERRKVIASL